MFENLLDDNGRKHKTSKSGLTITDRNGDLLIQIDRNGQKWRFADFLDGKGRKRNFRFLFFRLGVTEKRKNRHYFNDKIQKTISFANDI